MKATISNFKCFQKQEIEFRRLTVFAGANSVGKSSVIQTLLLTRASLESTHQFLGKRTDNQEEKWNGSIPIPINNTYLLTLGNSAEVLNRDAPEDIIRFGFSLDDFSIEFTFEVPKNARQYDIVLSSVIGGPANSFSFAQHSFYYLNAERTGPRLNYKMVSLPYLHAGYDGSHAVQVLQQIRDTRGDEKRSFDGMPQVYSLQVQQWMAYITPGVDVSTPLLYEKALTAEMSFGQSSPTNVGFGVSYILPIIVNGLIAEKGSMFIVENPEAHLHPSGQSRMGRFLAKIAAAGVQVVVETHSEHIINGIRIACLDKAYDLSPNDVLINFFHKGEDGKITAQPIGIKESGDFSKFPKDFFDQTQQDLLSLINLKKQIKQ